jgi:hypothetical protein
MAGPAVKPITAPATAPTGPRHEQPVAGKKRSHDERVGVGHVPFEPVSDRKAENLCDLPHRADTGVVEGDLTARLVVENPEQLQDVRMIPGNGGKSRSR